ncbi:MAG: hypothetical protein ABRQ25_04925 [Clostridiaceae bacterium]
MLEEKLVFDPALSEERGYPVAVLKDIQEDGSARNKAFEVSNIIIKF